MPAVSIIMPVYNAEKYLCHAIDSVLNQTFTDFELILVDDGSKDRSPKICDEYACKDKRVVVCHKQNGGICDARNKGLALAKGDYIGFIDNDDEYGPNLIKDNYNLAIKNHADIVKYGYRRIKKKNNKLLEDVMIHSDKILIINHEELSAAYPLIKKLEVNNLAWNGLYAKKFLDKNKIFFNPIHRFGYEDYEFNMLLYPHIHILVVNPNVHYVWEQRIGNSTSTKFDISKLSSIIKIIKVEQDLLKQLKVSRDYYNERMTAGLSAYIGYLMHYLNTSSYRNRVDYVIKFHEEFGPITWGVNNPLQQKIYAYLYNQHCYSILLYFKNAINAVKKLKTGTDYEGQL